MNYDQKLCELQADVEALVLKELCLPENCMTLDGDHVINNRKDYVANAAERTEFKYLVKERLLSALSDGELLAQYNIVNEGVVEHYLAYLDM